MHRPHPEPQALPFACDSHVHIVGPKEGFPLLNPRSYTPQVASVADLKIIQKKLGLSRAVIVQPSFYGTDNKCMLAALVEMGDSGRGVGVISENCSSPALNEMHKLGVRGIRVNTLSIGKLGIEKIKEKIRRASAQAEIHGWHVQLFISPSIIKNLETFLKKLKVDIVIDHFAMIRPGETPVEEVETVCSLLKYGDIWLKLSGTYRIAKYTYDTSIDDLARRLISLNVDRLVWGSDWPHTPKHSGVPVLNPPSLPYQAVNTEKLIRQFWGWVDGDRNLATKILVDNPSKLYDFNAY